MEIISCPYSPRIGKSELFDKNKLNEYVSCEDYLNHNDIEEFKISYDCNDISFISHNIELISN